MSESQQPESDGPTGQETGSAPQPLSFPGADAEPPGRPDGDAEPDDRTNLGAAESERPEGDAPVG